MGTTKLTVTVMVEDQEYTATATPDGRVSIYRGREWAGDGAWSEGHPIRDCAAVLPDAVYDALGDALDDAAVEDSDWPAL